MKNEIWKDVVGYEGIYEVSNLGNVKSLGNNKTKKEKILKLIVNGVGYYQVRLCKKGNIKSRTIHQLVAETFLKHATCGYELVVHHRNDIKTDNRVRNLKIVTHRENVYKTQGKYSSKYKGVYWHKHANKWVSNIQINGKSISLGYYTNELQASQAYQNKLKEISL